MEVESGTQLMTSSLKPPVMELRQPRYEEQLSTIKKMISYVGKLPIAKIAGENLSGTGRIAGFDSDANALYLKLLKRCST